MLPSNHYLHIVIHVKSSRVVTVVWSGVSPGLFKRTKLYILQQEISPSLLSAGWRCLPEPLHVAARNKVMG